MSGLFTTHLLSLDALLTVIDSIEQHCQSRTLAKTVAVSSDGAGNIKPADGQIGTSLVFSLKTSKTKIIGYVQCQRKLMFFFLNFRDYGTEKN